MKLRRGVYVDFQPRRGGGWRAELRFQVSEAGDCYRFAGTDDNEPGCAAAALRRAVAGASSLLASPAMLHVLPAGSVAAISAMGTLADAARRDLLGQRFNGRPLYAHLGGPLGRLARALHAHKQQRSALAGGPLLITKMDDHT